jgi:predicted kinase
MSLPFPCPEPGRPVDWTGADYWWTAPMAECVQEPEHHGEGDVWTHTRMVCDELVKLPEWQALDAAAREVLFAAALLHDVAKPACLRVEDGRIRHPRHSPRGSIMARQILWDLDVPLGAREQVARLILFHQVPFFLIDDPDPVRKAASLTQQTRADHLAILARADARGRICAEKDRILDNIALFEEYCREKGCLDRPWSFPSDHSRFLYFRTPGRDPSYEAYDDTRCEVVLMSGLPGAGKSRWVAQNLGIPVISLDDLRQRLKVGSTGDQGPVVFQARETAREYLRRGESFAWDATNLTRDLRGRLIDLFAEYRARVRIVYVDATRSRLLEQNRSRGRPVREGVIEQMTRNWEVPDLTEAHRVDWAVGAEQAAGQ